MKKLKSIVKALKVTLENNNGISLSWFEYIVQLVVGFYGILIKEVKTELAISEPSREKFVRYTDLLTKRLANKSR